MIITENFWTFTVWLVRVSLGRFYFLLRPLSVYSMGDESSDEMNFSPTRKKTDIWVLFYFFLRHAKKTVIFFPKSVDFLSKNNQNLQNVSNKKKKSDAWIFCFNFFPSEKAQTPLSGSVAHRIYWEWPYYRPFFITRSWGLLIRHLENKQHTKNDLSNQKYNCFTFRKPLIWSPRPQRRTKTRIMKRPWGCMNME